MGKFRDRREERKESGEDGKAKAWFKKHGGKIKDAFEFVPIANKIVKAVDAGQKIQRAVEKGRDKIEDFRSTPPIGSQETSSRGIDLGNDVGDESIPVDRSVGTSYEQQVSPVIHYIQPLNPEPARTQAYNFQSISFKPYPIPKKAIPPKSILKRPTVRFKLH